jgi:RimJ/RimL family protein N-acetyltransferase
MDQRLPAGSPAPGAPDRSGNRRSRPWRTAPWFLDAEGRVLRLRPYQPRDRTALEAMYLDLDPYSRTLGVPPKSEDGLAGWLDHLLEDGWNIVASDDGDIVGHVAVVPADADEPEFVIFVHQEYQNSGIGSELLTETVTHVAAAGYDGLRLTVATGNEAAIAVFENLGFEVTKQLKWEQQMRLGLESSGASGDRLQPAECP